ncbi:MAG: hypothetical protein D6E12_07570 [Desulfovibrio sp.]|nr:MAG: hypothetical protein D6E12_07570 [Desulfovibrio sp.]
MDIRSKWYWRVVTVVLILSLYIFVEAKKRDPPGTWVNSHDDKEAILERYKEHVHSLDNSGRHVWMEEYLFSCWETRVTFRDDGLPQSILVLRHVGLGPFRFTFTLEEYEDGCPWDCFEN